MIEEEACIEKYTGRTTASKACCRVRHLHHDHRKTDCPARPLQLQQWRRSGRSRMQGQPRCQNACWRTSLSCVGWWIQVRGAVLMVCLHCVLMHCMLISPLAASLRFIVLIVSLWLSLQYLLPDNNNNPLTPLILISYPLDPVLPRDGNIQRYGKGLKDLLFLAFYVLVFSFIRQTCLYHIIRPLAKKAGIKGERKLERFMEQGYAFMYWTTSSIIGLVDCLIFTCLVDCWTSY